MKSSKISRIPSMGNSNLLSQKYDDKIKTLDRITLLENNQHNQIEAADKNETSNNNHNNEIQQQIEKLQVDLAEQTDRNLRSTIIFKNIPYDPKNETSSDITIDSLAKFIANKSTIGEEFFKEQLKEDTVISSETDKSTTTIDQMLLP
eukprot:TCONS_00036340-protein